MNMNNNYNANIILSSMGTVLGVSIVDISNFLGLLITLINLGILVVTLILKLVKYIKNDGHLDKEEISDLLQDTKQISENIKEIKEHKDGKDN